MITTRQIKEIDKLVEKYYNQRIFQGELEDILYEKYGLKYLSSGATRDVYTDRDNNFVMKIGLYNNAHNNVEKKKYRTYPQFIKEFLNPILYATRNLLFYEYLSVDTSINRSKEETDFTYYINHILHLSRSSNPIHILDVRTCNVGKNKQGLFKIIDYADCV